MYQKFKALTSIFLMMLITFFSFATPVVKADTALGSKLLVGYWHNFDNGTGIIKLKDVSSSWDVINVSFGETGGDRATVQFSPCYGTDADFKAEVTALKSKGKKVVLSIGGQNGVVLLPDNTAKQNFINSLISLIDKYGFDGIDIDLESGISLNGGDSDFKNPTTPQLVNLISAIRTVSDHYGSNFILSMAPEIAYVQGGYTAYGNIWGAYLPIIYGLRDKLTYIHVQHYNAGSAAGMDGVNYAQGTADFEVAMADMLLHGFPVGGNQSNVFPALREDQVMIGIPACSSAAPSGGYIAPAEMKKALDYITKGISFGGKYKLSKSTGYPNFRGLMTWSINWDAVSNYEFSTNYRAYFGTSTVPSNSLKAATLSAGTVSNGSFTLTASVPAYNTATSYKFLEGTTVIASGTLTAGQASAATLTKQVTGKQAGTYNYTIQLADASGTVTSNQVSVTVPNTSTSPTLQAPSLSAGTVTSGSYTLTATVPANNSAATYKFFEGTTEIASGNLTVGNSSAVTLTKQLTNKAAGSYDYTVVVYDASSKSLTSNKVTVTVTSSSTYAAWAANVSYKVGDIVSYNGVNYKCLQAHTSLTGWEPSATPALWQAI